MKKTRKSHKLLKCLLLIGCAAMVYFHRRVILAWWNGDPMPEPSAFAKKCCPPLRKYEK